VVDADDVGSADVNEWGMAFPSRWTRPASGPAKLGDGRPRGFIQRPLNLMPRSAARFSPLVRPCRPGLPPPPLRLLWVAVPLVPVSCLALGPRRVLVPVLAIAGSFCDEGSGWRGG